MMKARLEAYRRKKHKEEMIESLKSSIKGVLPWNGNSDVTLERLSNEVSNEETEKLCQVFRKNVCLTNFTLINLMFLIIFNLDF